MSIHGTGLEGLGSEDFVIPRRSLVQNTSRVDDIDGAMPGMFVDETTRTLVGKQMHIAVLRVRKSRALFHPKDTGLKGIKCWSRDAITPDSSVATPVSATCKACPEQWRDLQYDLLCYDVDESETINAPVVFWLRAKGTSMKPTRTYLSTLLTRKSRAFDYTVTLTGPRAVSKHGSYFVLNFAGVTVANDLLKAKLEQAYQLYAVQSADEAELIAEEVDVDADPVPF